MISRKYDEVIERHAGAIPLPFLRVLAQSESGMNAEEVTGTAVGLFQVVRSVLRDYNAANGTNYGTAELKDPEVNAAVAGDLLNRIVRSYAAKHPSLQPDWHDARFVNLLVMGYNAGYSEAGGVGRVVGAMEAADIPAVKINAENVATVAEDMKLSRYLYDEAKLAYQKKVTRRYFDEIGEAFQKPLEGVSGYVFASVGIGLVVWGVSRGKRKGKRK